jgi:hypothetical protein
MGLAVDGREIQREQGANIYYIIRSSPHITPRYTPPVIPETINHTDCTVLYCTEVSHHYLPNPRISHTTILPT